MKSTRPTAAERYDTWDPEWEARLVGHVRGSGFANVWEYLRSRPGRTYAELAEEIAGDGGFGVAPIQIERLQARQTPDAELRLSVRDSLVRHLRHSFKALAWRDGPYWESTAIGALVSWSAMWSERVDISHLKHRMFEQAPPAGWLPADDRDPYVVAVVPDDEPL